MLAMPRHSELRCITLNAQCTGFEQNSHSVLVHFKDRESEKADILIGADGINSVVRRRLFAKDSLRYSGQLCFRGLLDYQIDEPGIIREVQGRGQRSSAMAINKNRVYWWAAIKHVGLLKFIIVSSSKLVEWSAVRPAQAEHKEIISFSQFLNALFSTKSEDIPG
jgi:2-polyprenyl-6-methoxyphenol hydroxylase-like FAD-dependent oxidoreductase